VCARTKRCTHSNQTTNDDGSDYDARARKGHTSIAEIGSVSTRKSGVRSLESFYHMLLSSVFGSFGIVWQKMENGPKVQRVFLPNKKTPVEKLIHAEFVDSTLMSCRDISELGERIQRFLRGEPARFELGIVSLEICSAFQRRVLLAEYGIPRGWISTYGRISKNLGIPSGARAVGRALSRNPFPIIIPCHRAVRSNGELGGFQGGLRMKKALLEYEGVSISDEGKVLTTRIYY
jgi:methylated-DNA-[protein]-cysteine S-methyltransferase